MPTRHQNIRNTVARSPLLRKGGVHQRLRSGERQQNKRQLDDALDEWLLEQLHRDHKQEN